MAIKYKIKNIQKGMYFDLRRFRKFATSKNGKPIPIKIVIGARGVGKTKSTRDDLKEQVEINNRKFLFLFRKDEELKDKKTEIFEPLGWIVEGKWVYKIETRTRHKKRTAKQIKDGIESKLEEYEHKVKIGRMHSVNLATDLRSGMDYVKEGYNYILWDEFQDELGKEMGDEGSKFFSILETILRTSKNADVILMSNNVKEDNAILRSMGIRRLPQQGEMLIKDDPDYGNILCLYVPYTSQALLDARRKSIVGAVTKGSEYAQYAYKNQSRFISSNAIIDKPSHCQPQYNFYWHDKSFCIWNMKEGGFWIGTELHPSLKTYGFTHNDANKYNAQFSPYEWMQAILRTRSLQGLLYFESGEILEMIGDMIR